jgi:hypothetical protein
MKMFKGLGRIFIYVYRKEIMPAKKYHTEEERLEARRACAKRFYENHKHEEAFKERQRVSTKKFNESHRELVALRSKQYYWANEKYRVQDQGDDGCSSALLGSTRGEARGRSGGRGGRGARSLRRGAKKN